MDFSETVIVYDLKWATDDRSDKKFLLTSKLCPLGAVCPLPQGYIYIYVLNHEKKMYKIRLQRDFEICNKWVKWLGLSFDIKILCPGGCLPLPRSYIHVLNHEKNCLKSDIKDIFFKLATNEWNDKSFLLKANFVPWRLSAPAPGLYTCIKSWKKCIKSDFETCNKWPKW